MQINWKQRNISAKYDSYQESQHQLVQTKQYNLNAHFFYDENNISTKHNKTNVRMKQQKQILLINQKSQDLPVLKIPPLRHGKKKRKMIERQEFPSASVWLRLHPKHAPIHQKFNSRNIHILYFLQKHNSQQKNKKMHCPSRRLPASKYFV